MKLTLDEREVLTDLLSSSGWPILLKVIDAYASKIDESVMKYNLDSGDRGLVIERARADGSRKLQIAIQQMKQKYLKADSSL